MSLLQDQFRQCLIAADVDGARRIWAHVFPNMPQAPARDRDVLVQIHIARTQMTSIPLKLRAWSHRWLLDNGYPSMLPDDIKPKAERIYPRIAEAVGIAVVASSPMMKPVAKKIERAMADAVEDAFAEGRREPEFLKARMQEARDKQHRYFAELFKK